jgi:hypothetical protein
MQNKCRFCDSNNINLLWIVFDPVNINHEKEQISFELYECEDCYLRYKADYYSDEQLEKFYANLPNNTRSSSIDKSTKKLMEKRKILINKYLTSWTIMDIWCFNGHFLEYLWNKYQRYWVEPSDVSLPKWITKIQSSFEDYKPGWNTFDLVLLLDVMEHIKDPHWFLNKVDKVISKKWFIIIDTGDFSSINAKIFWVQWWYYNMLSHCTFYSSKSLSKILWDLWFTVLENIKTDRRWFSFRMFILASIYKIFKVIAKYTYLYKISFFKKYYFHTPPIFMYKDHSLILAQKNT